MSAAELKAQGTEAFKKKNFDEAIHLYTQAIKANTGDHLLYSNRAAAYASLLRYEESLVDARKCVELQPDFAKGYGRVGLAEYHLNRPEAAQKAYQEGLARESANKVLLDGLRDVERALAAAGSGERLHREQILMLLDDAAKVQSIVQRKVNEASQRSVANGKKSMAFLEAHEVVRQLALPRDPLDRLGMQEEEFQEILGGYEQDEKVMQACQPLFSPQPQGDPAKATALTVPMIVDMHRFMTERMRGILEEFKALPEATRQAIPRKDRDRAAELIVSVDVAVKFGIGADVLEMATFMNGMSLEQDQAFAECTQQLAELMRELEGPLVADLGDTAVAGEPEPLRELSCDAPDGAPSSSSSDGTVFCVAGVAVASLAVVALLLSSRRSRS